MATASSNHSNQRRLLLMVATPFLVLLFFVLGPRLFPTEMHETPSESSPLEEIAKRRPTTHPPAPPRPRPIPMKVASPELQRALEQAVEGQISSFRKGDYAAALGFSSPNFRNGWDPERFRSMIWGGYQPLPLSARTEFQKAQTQADQAVLQATVFNKAGERTVYSYILMREGNHWYILGCSPVGVPPSFGRQRPIDVRDI